MAGDTRLITLNWPTFFGRIWLTLTLSRMLWIGLRVLIRAVWQTGATASFSLTVPQTGKSVTVTATKGIVTTQSQTVTSE